jgi:selenide,water dikinase
MLAVGVDACTDVTGFGLAGHLAEMLDASQAAGDGGERGVAAVIHLDALPLHERVLEFIEGDTIAHGLRNNRDYLLPRFTGVGLSDSRILALFDPQTSGGLLMAVAGDCHERLVSELTAAGAGAYTIGEVVAGPAGSVALADRHG